MKRIALFLVCLSLVCGIVTAQTQKGYVKTKGRMVNGTPVKGVRLAGATVTVRGRNAVVSASNGTFSLVIPSNNYYLQNVQKQGYVLNDPDILSRQYSQSKNPLVLVMETPDEQLEDKLEAMEKIRATLYSQLMCSRDEIRKLKEQNKLSQQEYQQKLQELAAIQEDNERLVNEMAERYSKIDYDQLDAFNALISRCILNGELTKADSMLNSKGDINARAADVMQMEQQNESDEADLAKRKKKLDSRKSLVTRQKEDVAQDCYSKYEMFMMKHLNDSAAHYIELRSSLDPSNVDWCTDAGGFIRLYMADYAKALELFQQCLDLVIQREGELSHSAIVLYNHIGTVYYEMAKYDLSLERFRKALELEQKLYGDNDHSLVVTQTNMGLLNAVHAKYDEASEWYQKALANPCCLQEDSIRTYLNLGALYIDCDQLEQATQCYEQALQLTTSHYGTEEHRWMASSYNGLAAIYGKQDDYAKAIDYHKKSLDINRRLYGENHPDVAIDYNNIGSTYSRLGKYAEGQEYLFKALAIDTLVYGKWHPTTAYAYNNLGYNLTKLAKYEQALSYYQEALHIDQAFYGEAHGRTATDLENIGSTYSYMKDYAHAQEYHQTALNLLESVYGENHVKVATCYSNLGDVYLETGDYDKAEEMLLKALSIDLTVNGAEHTNTATTYNNLGRLYNKTGDYAKSAQYMEKTFPILIKAHGENHPNVAISYYNVGILHKKQGDYAKALELMEKAYSILSDRLPKEHPVLQEFTGEIGKVKELLQQQKKKK